MILSKLFSCFWVPFKFKTWRIGKVNGLTLIIIVFIGGSGIVQIQETENVNRNNQPEGGKGVGWERARGRENSLLSSSCYLPLFILFSLFRAILHYLDALDRENHSQHDFTSYLQDCCSWFGQKIEPTTDRQTSAPPSELTRGGWYLLYCIYQYTEQCPIKRIISQGGRQKNKTKQKQQKTT